MIFNHLHFRAKNVAETQAFYEAYFGFRFLSSIRSTTVLTNPDKFLLAIDSQGEESLQKQTTNSLHFGFCLDCPQKVELLYKKMLKQEIAFAQPYKKISENAVSFYCFDPAGNTIEVGWYRSLPVVSV